MKIQNTTKLAGILTMVALSAATAEAKNDNDDLVPINTNGYVIQQQWGDHKDAIRQLEQQVNVRQVRISEVLDNLYSKARKTSSISMAGKMDFAFRWSSIDEDTSSWSPRGITGSGARRNFGTVANKQVTLVSWRSTGSKDLGVRVSIVDHTNTGNIRYAHLLLIEPFMDRGNVPNFRAVKAAAQGMAWYGDRLYVSEGDTEGKTVVRVFDTSNILEFGDKFSKMGRAYFSTLGARYSAHSFTYAIPQITSYKSVGSKQPVFDGLSIDRSSSPAALVSVDTTSGSNGKIFRWDISGSRGWLKTGGSTEIYPSEGYSGEHTNVQGAVQLKGLSDAFFLSCSGQRRSGKGGLLYRSRIELSNAGKGTTNWGRNPQDLYVEAHRNRLWTIAGKRGKRVVFAMKTTVK